MTVLIGGSTGGPMGGPTGQRASGHDRPSTMRPQPHRRLPGYLHLTADDVRDRAGRFPTAGWARFAASWDRLPADPHMADGGTYRCRRYGRFRLMSPDLKPVPFAVGTFFQPRSVNPLNGGLARRFAPLESHVVWAPELHRLIRAFARLLPDSVDEWRCGVHQIRINASRHEVGKPTPEGVHRDGHDYVAHVLIGRRAVTGGVTRLYSPNGELVYSACLGESMESILLDDRALRHDVTPIAPADPAATGHRDVLLLDYVAQQ